MTVVKRLREIRIAHNMSQESLAELAGVSRQTVSKWETGAAQPSGSNLAKLSEIFHVPIDALVREDWTPPEETPPEPQIVEVPVEVPVPRPRNYRLLALLAALLLAVGIAIGALFLRERHEDALLESKLESEVIDDTLSIQHVPIFPME